MTTTEEGGAAARTDATDGMTGPGAPETIPLGMIIGGLIEVPPKTQTEPKASECSKEMIPPLAPPSPVGQPPSLEGQSLLTAAGERGIEQRLQKEQENCSVSCLSQNQNGGPGRDTQAGEAKKLSNGNDRGQEVGHHRLGPQPHLAEMHEEERVRRL